MPAELVGRLVGARPGEVTLTRVDTAETVRPDAEGYFRLAVDEPGDGSAPPIRLRLRRSSGMPVEIDLERGDHDGEVVVLVPELVGDPVEEAVAAADRLDAERQARAISVEAVHREMGHVEAAEGEVRDAVEAVLSSVADARSGASPWRADRHASLQPLVDAALQEGRRGLDEIKPVLRVTPGAISDGDSVDAATLAARITGRHEHVLHRRSAADTVSLRRSVTDHEGLPLPLSTSADGDATTGDGGPVAATTGTVDDKVRALVDAMRLPEDPPLLVADPAISSSGSEVELPGGPADTTAVHDLHELVLAMPSVWAEVFDPEFEALVERSVREVVNAGVSLDAVVGDDGGRAARPEARLEKWLSTVSVGYAGSQSLQRMRPGIAAIRPGLADGLFGGDDGIIHDPRFPSIPPPPPPTPDPPGPWLPPNRDVGPNPGEVAVDPTIGTGNLLTELRSKLKGRHSFTVFPADGANRSLNFGVLLTWRQRWDPLSYQTGEIVHTTTLAPGETRKIVTKTSRRRTRAVAEAESSQRSSSESSTDTVRNESEIVRRAAAKTNFQLTSGGSTRLLVQDGKFSTSASRDVGKEGSDTRQRFREAVLNAAQEVREEHSITVNTESEFAVEEETTSELVNPHKELAMTCVLYSLQRRYQVSEQLHRAMPVVLVAMPVPARSQITTGWLVRHAWILERCLLADRFRPALKYLSTTYLGDTEALGSLSAAVAEQRKALNAAQHRVQKARSLVEHRSESLAALRNAIASGDGGSVMDLPGLSLIRDVNDFVGGLFGGGDDDQDRKEREAMLVAAAEDELERADREARDAATQLGNATNAYQEAVRDYVEAKRTQRNHEVRIAELRVHVADNILHYMQTIWATQPPDQRFFELHNVQVPILTGDVVASDTGVFSSPGVGGTTPAEFELAFPSQGTQVERRSLAEVADLDDLLGFKGNYAMFPLRRQNALTEVLLAPYLDADEVLRDPDDEAANWTIERLRSYADELRQQVRDGVISQQDFDTVHAPFLRETLERLVTDPRPASSEVVVPSDSLFAELLSSGSSLIDEYMRTSRALDVAKSRADIRSVELENLRRAARLDADELADPDMDDFERHLLRTDPPPP